MSCSCPNYLSNGFQWPIPARLAFSIARETWHQTVAKIISRLGLAADTCGRRTGPGLARSEAVEGNLSKKEGCRGKVDKNGRPNGRHHLVLMMARAATSLVSRPDPAVISPSGRALANQRNSLSAAPQKPNPNALRRRFGVQPPGSRKRHESELRSRLSCLSAFISTWGFFSQPQNSRSSCLFQSSLGSRLVSRPPYLRSWNGRGSN